MRCFGWMGGLGVRAWGLGCSLPVIPSTARDLLSAPPARSLAALGMTSEPGGHAGPDCCPNRAHPAPKPPYPPPQTPPTQPHPPHPHHTPTPPKQNPQQTPPHHPPHNTNPPATPHPHTPTPTTTNTTHTTHKTH